MASGMSLSENSSVDSQPATSPALPATEELAWRLAIKVLAESDGVSAIESNALGQRRVLISSLHRGQTAHRLAELGHGVTLFEFEHYRWRLYQSLIPTHPNLEIVCSPDPPMATTFDLVVLSVRRDWGAELTRDLLQAFAGCVASQGTLVVVADHPDDQWVGDQLRDFSKQVKRYTAAGSDTSGQATSGATAYLLPGNSLKVRQRDFRCQFAFRDRGRLLQVVTRPGVFSHRKLDLGARRLMDTMEVNAGQRVLDIGCGSGVVAFAAAARGEDIHVVAIDSNSRAIDCVRQGASLNQLQGQVEPILSSDGSVPGYQLGDFDVALANPPYFANLQIAELFLAAAQAALKPGGTVWVVGKQPEWYRSNVPRWFDNVELQMVGGGYCIAKGRRPA